MTSQLIAEMLTAAAPSMANHLWQSTAFAAVVWLLALALKKNHARVRYWLWLVASVKFLIPFSLLIAAGGYLRPATVAPMAPPVVSAVMEQMTQPFSQTLSPTNGASTVVVPSVVAHNGALLPTILLSVWACGSLIVAFSWWRRWRTIRAAVREASYMTMVADVPVLSSPSLLEPGVFGIFRPVLLLPEDITVRLTESQLSAILAHEMCHVRRRDNFTAAVHMVVEAAFWFHPATWWISTRLVEERERACDEAVLRAGSEALVYAEGILNVCKFYVESRLACASGVTGSDLKKRIGRIMAGQVEHKLDLSRKLLLSTAGLLAVAAPIAFGTVHATVSHAQSPVQSTAPDISGTWQGTLQAGRGRDLRTILNISKADGGAWKVLFYGIDERPGGSPATAVSLQGSTFTFSIDPMLGNYTGKVSADGKSIAGTWTQNNGRSQLDFSRPTKETAWAIPDPPLGLASPGGDALRYDVASIKPNGSSGTRFVMVRFTADGFTATGLPLKILIQQAYGVDDNEILGAPDWVSSETYDIEAKVDSADVARLSKLTRYQRQLMLQPLLADRFKLKVHTETKELSVYALVVAKSGPKLHEARPGDTYASGLKGPDGRPSARDGVMQLGGGHLIGQGVTIGSMLAPLSHLLGRSVLDNTGLTGKYDINLQWTPDEGEGPVMRGPAAAPLAPPPPETSGPSIFSAFEEQLGLKLESTKAPVEVLVIDHVEKPSEN